MFDPDRYFTGKSTKNKKWKIDFNGLGTLDYCPVVEKTEKLKQAIENNVLQKVADWFENLEPMVAASVLQSVYFIEAKKTFEIEREVIDEERAYRFAKFLERTLDVEPLTEEYLCSLQNKMVGSEVACEKSYRHEQNYLAQSYGRGHLSVSYVPPPPEQLEELIYGWRRMVDNFDASIDPIVSAGVASFGFVYLHPFMDGNGRISRFLIHRQLCRSGRLSQGFLLPISAAMKENEQKYFMALLEYSAKVRNQWRVFWKGTEKKFEFKFLDSDSIYRYWNATVQTEFLFDMAEETLNKHLKAEAEYLEIFDAVYRQVNELHDIRQSHMHILITAALSNNGKLSKNIRKRFEEKVPEVLFSDIESAISGYDRES